MDELVDVDGVYSAVVSQTLRNQVLNVEGAYEGYALCRLHACPSPLLETKF